MAALRDLVAASRSSEELEQFDRFSLADDDMKVIHGRVLPFD